MCYLFSFFNDTATTEIYTLSLHDALPIFGSRQHELRAGENTLGSDGSDIIIPAMPRGTQAIVVLGPRGATIRRSEEHTSELQSRLHLVCRLLLEKKKQLDQQRHLGFAIDP